MKFHTPQHNFAVTAMKCYGLKPHRRNYADGLKKYSKSTKIPTCLSIHFYLNTDSTLGLWSLHHFQSTALLNIHSMSQWPSLCTDWCCWPTWSFPAASKCFRFDTLILNHSHRNYWLWRTRVVRAYRSLNVNCILKRAADIRNDFIRRNRSSISQLWLFCRFWWFQAHPLSQFSVCQYTATLHCQTLNPIG